ncbi:MAG TPA: AAA family ATPase [Thermoanaerobaculia bacterium]|nr:AAA family ATPase [Thermoanaerobaculia bacterium]
MNVNAAASRYIRPFVSSTFLDLKEERDALVNIAFPRIRRYCDTRGITWSAVDLRWGIDSEDRILPVCLEEVARSQPFFIGVLGERYGTVLESIPEHLKIRYPWLERYPHRSIAELEIIRGALEECQGPVIPFFYFRDPQSAGGPQEDTPPDRRRADAKRLKYLKRRIRRMHPGVLRTGFRSPEELAEWVEQDFIRTIDELYPLSGVPTAQERYALDQRAFALSRKRLYVPDPGVVLELDVHATGTGDTPLVLVGESGSGKSAALANWVDSYAQRHPEAEDLVVTHFVGGAADGGRLDVVLRQLVAALRADDGTDAVADGKAPDADALAHALRQASQHRRVILVIDGIDQLEDRGGALDLAWLPNRFPPKMRVFLSTLPGRSATAAQDRKWRLVDMPLLKPKQAAELIRQHLDAHGKKEGLRKAELEEITDAPQAANPLFLFTLLDELVPLGSRLDVETSLADLLPAKDVSALYEKVLARYARDHHADRPGLVRDAFSLIWASRRGLSEAELLDLLGSGGQPLPSAHWSELALRADRMFLLRSGLLTFSHAHLRAAVEQQFVSTEAEKHRAHRTLAAYFGSRHTDPVTDQAHAIQAAGGRMWRKRMQSTRLPVDRRTEEYPWQLEQAQQWTELARWLSSLPDALFGFLKARPDVLHYWAQVEASSDLRAVDLLRPVLEAPEQHHESISLAMNVLSALGHTEHLERLAARVVEAVPDGSEELATALFTHVHALIGAADFDAAEKACAAAMETFARTDKQAQQAETLRLLSDIATQRGDLDRALALEREAVAILKRLGITDEANRTFRIQAGIHQERGDRDSARECLERAAQVSRDEDDLLGLVASLSQLGDLLEETQHSDDAGKAYEEAENVLLGLGEPDLLSVFYFNRAVVLQNLDRWYQAKKWYDKSEAYAKRIGNANLLARTQLSRASGLSGTDREGALGYANEALSYFRGAGAGESANLEAALSTKAVILSAMGRDEEAEQCHVEAIAMARRLGPAVTLTRCLSNYALLLLTRDQRLDQALELLDEARVLLDPVADAEPRAAVIRVAQIAADKIGGRMMAADFDDPSVAEGFAERLRRWEEEWKLPTAGVHFLARAAVPAVLSGDTRKALPLLDAAATRLAASGDSKDGHAILRRSLIYLTDHVNPTNGDPLEALADAERILEPKIKILRALGAEEELIRAYLVAAGFLALSFELFPLELNAAARAIFATQPELPLDAPALALDCIQRAIHSVDEAARLAKLYQPRAEMFAEPPKPLKQRAEIMQAYELIANAIARRAARLEEAGAKADACRLLFVRAGVARLTQEPGPLSATLSDLALKLAGLGEAARARDMAAEAASLARGVGDAALELSMASLLRVEAPPLDGESAAAEPIEPDAALDEEDRKWIADVATMFEHVDTRAPGLIRGSPTDDIRAFLAPHMTSDLEVLKNALRLFMSTTVVVGITDKFSLGMVCCPRCGDYAAPQGREPGVATVICGTCKRELQCRMIEYSPHVGRVVATLAAEHANVTALVKRAKALRSTGEHTQAAALAVRAATTFRQWALPLAEAGALMEAAAALRDGGDAVAARAAQADAFRLLFDLKDVSALTGVLIGVARHDLDTRSAAAMAVLGLLIDIVHAHDPELEANADAANALFMQALIASRSIDTLEQARKKYDEAFEFLTGAVNQPGGRKLMSRGFEKRFALLQGRLSADHAGLFELAKKTQAALDAEQHEAAQLFGAELFKLLAELQDTRSMLALANRLTLVNFQRRELGQALECLKIQAALADRPGDARIRANALRNQSVLEQALESGAAPATLAEAEALERLVETAPRDLAAAKLEAEQASSRNDPAAAADAWARAADAAETLGDTKEQLQALMHCIAGYASATRWVAALQAALEAEALTASTAAVAHALTAQAEALAALGDGDTAAMRQARAAPGWQACLKLAAQQPQEVQAALRLARDEALRAVRRKGDERDQNLDLAGAERFYRASSAAAAACVAIDATDLPVRITNIADLDQLGVVIARQGEHRREEGQALSRQALEHLDDLDTLDPGGIERRSELRRELNGR